MITDFERTRLEIDGKDVTVTSWYDPEKRQFQANAPSLGHILKAEDVAAGSTGATREEALRAIQERIAKRLAEAGL